MDIKVGDFVRLECPNLIRNLNTQNTYIEGVVVQIFDKLFEDSTPGNYEIDIKNKSIWIRYIPSKDGGTLRKVTR